MAKIAIQTVPKRKFTKRTAVELLASLCYYYPQYTLAAARRLPHKHVILLIKTAQKMEATKYYNLTQIAAAPQTKKGEGVKKLLESYQKQVENG